MERPLEQRSLSGGVVHGNLVLAVAASRIEAGQVVEATPQKKERTDSLCIMQLLSTTVYI